MSDHIRTGWVYVYTNESMPGLVKVGVTGKHPEKRAQTLDGTALPTPFDIATAFLFADKAFQIEQKAHSLLKDYRVSPNREHFRCSALDAAFAVKKASEDLGQLPVEVEPVLLTPDEIAAKEKREEDQRLREEENLRKIAAEKEEENNRYIAAEIEIGNSYAHASGATQNWREAARHYENAATKGDAKAQYLMGMCYYNGRGVERDLTKAKEWFVNSSKQDYVPAHYKLARCLVKMSAPEPGELRGGFLDEYEVAKLYRKAAEHGMAAAQYHFSGYSKRSEKEMWLLKAAEQGHAEAQYALGKCCEARRQYVEALKWIRPSADAGCCYAQALLADFYLRGKGVPRKDLIKARKWIEQAAATLKGDPVATLMPVSAEGDWLEPSTDSLLKEITSERVDFYTESIRQCDNYQYLRKTPKKAEILAVIKALDKAHPEWDKCDHPENILIHNLHANFKRLRGKSAPPSHPSS